MCCPNTSISTSNWSRSANGATTTIAVASAISSSIYGDWGGVLNYDRTREIVKFLTDRFVSGQTDEIVMIFTRFLSMVRYQVSVEKYLPVAKPAVQTESKAISQYIFEPNAEQIYAALMPSYAVTKMVTALVESFASEHGSRMIAMGNATKNAGEMVQTLDPRL